VADIPIVETSVLIVGGGPVGLVVAIELGRRGIPCVVLNDSTGTARHPKANAIGARTMEHFRRLGVATPIRAAGLDDDHPTDVAYFTSLTGIELARLHMPGRTEALRMARSGEGPWPTAEPPHRCSQIHLEKALYERARGLAPVDLRFGWRFLAFREERDRVIGEAEEVATGRRIAIRARYLAGCDGGNSTVRRQLGIEYQGERGVVRPMMGGSMNSCFFRVKPEPRWLSVGRSWQYWVVRPDIRALLIHVDSRDQWLTQIRVPDEIDRKAADPRELVSRAARADVPIEVISTVPWLAGHSLVAPSYGGGRVFLAGDSCHLFTPTGGLGMNTGVDDAVNLAWKLAALCQGWGGSGLLASYAAERRPIGIRNVEYARTMAESIGHAPVTGAIDADTSAGRVEREALGARLADHAFREFIIPGIQLGLRYDSSPAIVPDGAAYPPDTATECTQAANPGMRAPHLWLGETPIHDRFGPEFTLLKLGPADPAPIREAARARGLPLALVELADARARDLYGADLVLIRPDQHVAWRGNAAPPDPERLIDTVLGG
jgi:2-polyprenyl-6-methoxyphenol hydroxylase-like FAD-dependent oxidoreductase